MTDEAPGTAAPADDSQSPVRLSEIIGRERAAELARESRESERRMAARRRGPRQAPGTAGEGGA